MEVQYFFNPIFIIIVMVNYNYVKNYTNVYKIIFYFFTMTKAANITIYAIYYTI